MNFNFAAAEKLPTNIRFGTSTWTYPAWKGLIYNAPYKSEKEFNTKSLAEYSKFPWFRTVGIDHTFYRPPNEKLLVEYSELVPQTFVWVSKVWEEITTPRFPKHPRYGRNAGRDNPHFLNSKMFIERVLTPYRLATVLPHTGPFVFQFPTISKELVAKLDFLPRLFDFLSHLPNDFRYAIELRNRELLTKPYFQGLNQVGATHCFNHWHYMPALREQMRLAADAGGLAAPFFVCRLLTPLGVSYEEAVNLFMPYDMIKQPNEAMRHDAAQIARRAIELKKEAFIIVNNRSEGCSPLTIDAIGQLVVHSIQ